MDRALTRCRLGVNRSHEPALARLERSFHNFR
jgi:hypothetical protein